METFDNIHMDFSKVPGRCRFAETGMGWKPTGAGDAFTLSSDQILHAFWNRAARGYEVKLYRKDAPVVQFDGFNEEDYERIQKLFKNWYATPFERNEHSLRGWNWGKAEFGKAELSFNVQSRSAFEIPYTEVSNTNLAGKGEVAVEFTLPPDDDKAETNGTSNGARSKAANARDQLMEMRFYIPGMTATKIKDDEDGEDGELDETAEEQQAADVFYQTLSEKAEIGEVAGDTYATFQDVLHLTPRGRFDVDMYKGSFRLRGKTYDYKIQYESVKKFMILPKPDELHVLLTIGLDPPLRQGQTRYPFVVMQMNKEEEVVLDLNMTDEEFEQHKGKLQKNYEAPLHSVVAAMFRGLAGKKLTVPSKDFLSHHGATGVKCSIKANEGLLYCMDKSFMFVPKPATYVNMDQVSQITMSRIGGHMAASRTFDITMAMKGGGDFSFSNINREEQQPLENFFRLKGLRVKNEMAEDAQLISAALNNVDMGSSDDEVVANRGSADEDSESADEDFQGDSDSDVAEEFDSQHDSSGGESDAEIGDADDGDASDVEEVVEPPKKKSKKAK